MREKMNNENSNEKVRELYFELKRQMNTSYDMVVPSDRLIAVKNGNQLALDIVLTDEEKANLPNYNTTHDVNSWAKKQIATKTGIPLKYFRKMEDNGKIDLLADNVNTWMPDKEKRMVRVLDGNVRALLSSKYKPINNYDVLFLTIDEIKKVRENGMLVDTVDARVSDTKLYLKLTSPDLSADIEKFNGIQQTEPVQGGMIISNSEVGNGAFCVQPFINVLVCTNGLISDRALRKVHVGADRKVGLIEWSDETKKLDDELLFSKIRDMIQKTFNKEIFNQWIDEINEVAKIKVPKPRIAIQKIAKHFNLTKLEEEDILNEFISNAPNTGSTQWGMSMAVTRVAQDSSNYDNRIEMEEIGAKLLKKEATPLVVSETE